jgi:hypothetical protein
MKGIRYRIKLDILSLKNPVTDETAENPIKAPWNS